MASLEMPSNSNLPPAADPPRIKRKPVSSASFPAKSTPEVSPLAQSSGVTSRDSSVPCPSPRTAGSRPLVPGNLQHLQRAAGDGPPFPHPPAYEESLTQQPVTQDFQRAATDFPVASYSTSSDAPPQSQSAVQKAFGEARHFLGGLINHPTESTKHFTILRHSHGIVFYRGTTTTIAISVFADAPLPPDRTYWLQVKGFTGKTGMKAKALLHLYNDWFEVTPKLAVRADQVDTSDERAWQRDLSKFRKKAPPRVRDAHQLRETVVARVPAGAEDGYYCILLCLGKKKKVLCTSPVFRLISTSTDPSSIRGSSLSTLPLELGALAVGTYTQTVTQSVLNPVSNAIQPYMPGSAAQTAAQTAYSMKEDDIKQAGGQYAQVRGKDKFELEQGPIPPYPITFRSRAELSGTHELIGSPRLCLVNPPEQTLRRFHGYYFGWARFENTSSAEDPSGEWTPMLLSVLDIDPSQLTRVSMSEATKRWATLQFLDEVKLPAQIKLSVRVLGYIRPDAPLLVTSEPSHASAQGKMEAERKDISVALNALNHPAWTPDAKPRNTTWSDRYGSLQLRQQQLLDRVPLDKVGIRKPGDSTRDKQVTVNGFYIKR